MNNIPNFVLADMQDDDDAIIDHYIEHNKKSVLCKYFYNGFCKDGKSCEYMHPEGSMESMSL